MTEQKFTDEEKILSLLKVSDDVYANAKLTPEESKALLDLFKSKNAEIERLRSFGTQVEVSEKIEKEIKAEAIKDFAERLLKEGRENVVKYTPEGCDLYFKNGTLCGYSAMKEVIDNLVKERIGAQEWVHLINE